MPPRRQKAFFSKFKKNVYTPLWFLLVLGSSYACPSGISRNPPKTCFSQWMHKHTQVRLKKIRSRKQNNRQKNIKLHGFVNFDDCGDPSTPRNPPGTSGGFPGGSWGLPSRPALGPNTADAWNAIFETAGLHTTILWETWTSLLEYAVGFVQGLMETSQKRREFWKKCVRHSNF